MGPWSYVAPRLATALRELSPCGGARDWRCIARPAAASPATPLFKVHRQEAEAVKQIYRDIPYIPFKIL